MIKLAAFLSLVGLPAQTIGAASASAAKVMVLNAKDCQEAQDILNKIRDECGKARRTPMTWFAEAKNQPSDVALRPQAFSDLVNRDLGQQFARQINLEKNMSRLVAYLAEELPGQISFRKLTLAMTQQRGEAPLKQEGASERAEYEAKLR